MTTIKLDPVTRLEGHMKIEVEIDSSKKVIAAKSTGNMFRGFEAMLKNRDPRDAVHITQRICGLCPVSHGVAAVKALEASKGFKPPRQAMILRNLIQGGNFVSDHILHFYHLSLLDYVKGPDKSPWSTSYNTDMRFSKAEGEKIFNNYVKALDIRRKAHQMVGLFAGRIPHVRSIMPGGVTKVPTANEISEYRNYLNEVNAFVCNEYYHDVQKVASVYKDYFKIGKGYGNLIAFGAFDIDVNGESKQLFRSGRYTNGELRSVNLEKITEDTKYSWYEDSEPLNVRTEGKSPSINKGDAYSWIKAPRYADVPHEAGPLARMWINGDYRNGISVMDRHVAKMLEAKKIANALTVWINDLNSYPVDEYETSNASYKIGNKYNSELYNPDMHRLGPGYIEAGEGMGTTEAPRGALLHYINYEVGPTSTALSVIKNYQVVTPTCWNASPKDSKGQMGPLEKALVGVQIQDINNPIELMRIVHSFDPCTACAVHIIDPEKEIRSEFIVSTPNPSGML